MAYIGREPQIGNFQICDAISTVNNQAAYTMQVSSVDVLPESANHMIVSLNGVIQKPNSSYTVSGATITFASNLVTGDVINFIQILGSVLDLGVPSDNTVTTAKILDANVTLAKLAGDSVNATKIADDAISEEHLDVTAVTGHTAETSIADGDLVLIHDASASALRKMTKANFVSGIGGTNTPNFLIHLASNQTLSDATTTLMAFATEVFDSDTAFTPTTTFKFVVPSGKAGVYQFYSQIFFNDASDNKQFDVYLYKNGSVFASGKERTPGNDQTVEVSAIITLAEGDRVQVYGRHNHGSNLVVDDGADLTYFYGYKLL
jgi:hypothetical protein